MNDQPIIPNIQLAHKLIAEQFPEYVHLPITDVEKQGHDNRTYRIGEDMLIRLPTAESYALKVPKEQKLLLQLAKHLRISIPSPIKMGSSSPALDLAIFLKDLHAITDVLGPIPGQHNWWRGDHVNVYDKGARGQIAKLANIIDSAKALDLWENACATRWNKEPVWVHGDFAIGNMLMNNGKLSAVIDFGGAAIGDPACDLVISWTYLSGKARENFMKEMNVSVDTCLRARAWALWKATFELCGIEHKSSPEVLLQKRIIDEVING